MYRQIPNILTILRLLSAPVVALLLLVAPDPTNAAIALVIYIIAALTDWLDGYLARRWEIVSGFGRMLDPIADKLMVIIMLITLMGTTISGPLLYLPAIIIVTREIMVSGLREYMAGFLVTVHVTWAAKLKTTCQLIAIGFIIAYFCFAPATPLAQFSYWAGMAILWLAALLTAQTGIAYFRASLAHIKD